MLGTVIWITGLSGAGKTTLSLATAARLRARGEAVVRLDGDELRGVFGAAAVDAQSHSREGGLRSRCNTPACAGCWLSKE
jgi:adenylylsulfate kinase-like enzyme